MAFILTDLSQQNLASSIQTNMHDFFRQFALNQPQPRADSLRWQTELMHPWFNGVLVDRSPEPGDESLIQELQEFYGSRGIQSWTWWVDSPALPQDWADLLGKAGFRFEHDTPGMAMLLANLPRDLAEVPGLTIRKVTSLQELKTWSHVFVGGYGLPLDWADPYFEMMAGLGLDQSAFSYLGELDGEPVAVSSVYLGAGVAGIYNVATLPQARRKGIGAALTVVPLQEAREMGYQAGILQSSQAGYGVYKKLGFEHLCEVEVFVWDG
jgi:GNAT superfamily N-acetyltransferase